MRIEVVRAWPTHAEQWWLDLPEGATLADAARALAALGVMADPADMGVWGRRQAPSHRLAAGDRIELYRPVLADPKAARLDRARQQGYRWQARTRRAARAVRSAA